MYPMLGVVGVSWTLRGGVRVWGTGLVWGIGMGESLTVEIRYGGSKTGLFFV